MKSGSRLFNTKRVPTILQFRGSQNRSSSYLGVWYLCSSVEDVVWDHHSRHAHQQWDEGRRLMPRPLHRHFPSSSPASHPSACCFCLPGRLRRTTMVQVIDGRSVWNGHQLPCMNAALVSCCPDASKQRYYALRPPEPDPESQPLG